LSDCCIAASSEDRLLGDAPAALAARKPMSGIAAQAFAAVKITDEAAPVQY
jgi:hypothetical protein